MKLLLLLLLLLSFNVSANIDIVSYNNVSTKKGKGFKLNNYKDIVITNKHVTAKSVINKVIYNDKEYYADIIKVSDKYDLVALKLIINSDDIKSYELCKNDNSRDVYVINNKKYNGTIINNKNIKVLSDYYMKEMIMYDIKKGFSGSAVIDSKTHCVNSVLTSALKNSNKIYNTSLESLKDFLSDI